MTHDKAYWKAEIDSLRTELAHSGMEDGALDTAYHLLDILGCSPLQDVSAMVGIYACLGFASGQLGDKDRLNRFIVPYG